MNNKQDVYHTLERDLMSALEDIAMPDALSLESDSFTGNAGSQYTGIIHTLNKAFDELSMLSDNGEEIDYPGRDECVKAGAIAYLASSDPVRYMKALRANANNQNAMSMESVHMGNAGHLKTVDMDDYTQESFDEDKLGGLAIVNATYNMLAARQEPALEAMFPTKVYTVAENGISLTTQLQEVITEARHPENGRQIELNRRKLFKGLIDYKILDGNSVALIPYADPKGDSDHCFVPDDVVATRMIPWGNDSGVTVPNRPLLIGANFNLMSLAQHPGVTGGKQLNLTDQISYGVRMTDIYVTIGDGKAGKVIHFNTSKMARTHFIKSVQGRDRQTTLNWVTKDLVVSAKTEGIAGATITELEAAIPAGYKVRLRTVVTGEMNLNTGETEVNASPVRVHSVINTATKREVSLEDGIGKSTKIAVEALKLEIKGYDIDPTASNSNWRFNGPIIDVTPHSEIYLIPPGVPITVLTPPNDQANQAKIQGMTNAMKIRTTNQGVTAFLNYHESLMAMKEAVEAGLDVEIEGIGRHIVDPYASFDQLDVLEAVQSWKSHERALDVQKVLVDKLRVTAWNMYSGSNYASALRLQTGSSDVRPRVIIWTDDQLPKYLLGMGGLIEEKNLLGTSMDCEIHTVVDARMRGKIYMTFTRGRPGVEDLTSYGVHAYIPELAQQLTVDRDGGTRTVNRVIPRNFHLPILPISAGFEVVNLEEALLNIKEELAPPTGP